VLGPLAETARECAELLYAQPADGVVLDWMLPGAVLAAERAGLPAVALVHGPLPLPVDGVPPLGLGLRPLDGPLGALRDRALNGAVRRMLALGLPALNRARTEHGPGRWRAGTRSCAAARRSAR
jgi:hypothetical protein